MDFTELSDEVLGDIPVRNVDPSELGIEKAVIRTPILGIHTATIDDKARITVPRGLRKAVATQFLYDVFSPGSEYTLRKAGSYGWKVMYRGTDIGILIPKQKRRRGKKGRLEKWTEEFKPTASSLVKTMGLAVYRAEVDGSDIGYASVYPSHTFMCGLQPRVSDDPFDKRGRLEAHPHSQMDLVELDNQGRVTLTEFRGALEINNGSTSGKEFTFVGKGDHIDLVAADRLELYNQYQATL